MPEGRGASFRRRSYAEVGIDSILNRKFAKLGGQLIEVSGKILESRVDGASRAAAF